MKAAKSGCSEAEALLSVPGSEQSRPETPALLSASAPLSLRKNFAWTMVGNLVYACSQWGMLVALTKLGSPEMAGQFALGLAVTSPVFLLSNLQLRAMQATDARGDYQFRDYFALRLATTALGLAAIVIVALCAGYRSETASVIAVLGLAKATESLSDVHYGLFQARERMDTIAVSMIIKGLLSLTLFVPVLYLTRSVFWAAVGLFAAWSLVYVVFDAGRSRKLLRPREEFTRCWNVTRLTQLAWLAMPLGLAQGLRGLELSLPRYFIEREMGERELGVFAALAYLAVAGTQVINALGQSASARLAKCHVTGDRRGFQRLLFRLVASGVLVGVVGLGVSLLAGPQLVTWMYSSEYAARPDVLCWLMAASGVTYAYVFLGTALNALRTFRVRVPLHLVTLITLAGLCAALGRRHGLAGVTWAICMTEALAAMFYAGVVLARSRRVASSQATVP